MKTEKFVLRLAFSDEGNSPMFWDKTLAVEITRDAVVSIKKMSEDCVQRGYKDISRDMALPNWTIDAEPADMDAYQEENPVSGRNPDILMSRFGNLRDHF